MAKTLTKTDGYSELRKQVEQTLLAGQRQIEQAKVQTYWQTGKLINEHILRYDSRSENYGKQVIEQLSEDLKIGTKVLWRCVQFARIFKKIVAPGRQSFPQQLTWSHYRQLFTIHDEQTRISFLKRAQESRWSSHLLAHKIHEEIRKGDGSQGEGDSAAKGTVPKIISRLIPKKGTLYTYRLSAPDSVHKEEDDDRLWIDVGFQVRRKLPEPSKGFKEGQIIESKLSNKGYSAVASDRKEQDLYTYKANVERVIDGDTLLVDIDLGFEMSIRQYLRLRGIDAPEIDTPEGKKAKAFVEKELSAVPYITLTSSRSDKYDRYLADVFYGEGENEKFLNQRLLDEGLAVRA